MGSQHKTEVQNRQEEKQALEHEFSTGGLAPPLSLTLLRKKAGKVFGRDQRIERNSKEEEASVKRQRKPKSRLHVSLGRKIDGRKINSPLLTWL